MFVYFTHDHINLRTTVAFYVIHYTVQYCWSWSLSSNNITTLNHCLSQVQKFMCSTSYSHTLHIGTLLDYLLYSYFFLLACIVFIEVSTGWSKHRYCKEENTKSGRILRCVPGPEIILDWQLMKTVLAIRVIHDLNCCCLYSLPSNVH